MSIAILGYGTVGKGCVMALKKFNIDVKRILDIKEIPEIEGLRTSNIEDILNDKDITVVAELMGGEHPAYDYVKAALLKGKNVVTANKQMLSKNYKELTELAEKQNVKLLYSATSGGGIPWIRNLKNAVLIDDIIEVGGVMNGTTNFILEKMKNESMSFDRALKMAQDLGYAEKDPTADVEGFDVRAKLAISSNVAFKTCIDPETIPTKGITQISDIDIKQALQKGKVIRLVAKAKLMDDGQIYTNIAPEEVDSSSPLYNLQDAENCFYFVAKQRGTVSFKGMGAGMGPTGANVAEDILEIIKNA